LFYDHPGRGLFQTSRVVVINRIVLLIIIIIIIIIIITSERFREGQHLSSLQKRLPPREQSWGQFGKDKKQKQKQKITF